MSTLVNDQFKLAARPVGMPKDSDWNRTSEPARDPAPGELLVEVQYLSLDPAMRGWMNDQKSYIPPVQLGEVMRAGGAGRVLKSGAEGFAEGDYVVGMTGVQSYATVPAKGMAKVDPSLAPLPTYLNVLGMPGMTAYFGLLDAGQPKEGETVVVSGAAGAVGMVVGQIAKIKGCRAIGIAGGPEKCAYIKDELGFDGAIDYKSEPLHAALKRECPKGIDVYFDNVGGDVLDACLAKLAMHGRIIICGAISQYNNTDAVKGPSNYLSLLVNRGRMEGIVVFDYADRFGIAVKELAGWMREGKMKSREDIVTGLETFPSTLLKLFHGENLGKLVLEVARN